MSWWSLAICLGSLLAAARLALLASSRRQPQDLVPDYLGRSNGSFLEQDGFCFTVSLAREDAAAVFTIMFQSRYSGRSTARIGLRPAGSNLTVFSPPIHCGPAGFGVAKFPVPIPAQHQGKTARFALGVQVDYPLGKGREVRFRPGRPVPCDVPSGGLPMISASLPHFLRERIFNRAATVRLKLPCNVAEYIPDEVTGGAEEIWSLSSFD